MPVVNDLAVDSLQLAISDLRATFGDSYPDAALYEARLREVESRRAEVLSRGDKLDPPQPATRNLGAA